jgi:hypothetical protein
MNDKIDTMINHKFLFHIIAIVIYVMDNLDQTVFDSGLRGGGRGGGVIFFWRGGGWGLGY